MAWLGLSICVLLADISHGPEQIFITMCSADCSFQYNLYPRETTVLLIYIYIYNSREHGVTVPGDKLGSFINYMRRTTG